MYPGDMPPYSPPARSSFTPPQPPHPFADKPTLRGTNSDSGIINTNNYINRRPIPPPSLTPGQERIPFRPPDLVGAKPLAPLSPLGSGTAVQQQHEQTSHQQVTPTNSDSKKKALNTPADKNKHKGDASGSDRSENGNSSDPLPNGGVFHFPSISRILSGSNGRKEVVPEVLLRSVTARPNYQAPVEQTPVSGPNAKDNSNLNQNRQGDEDNDGLSVEDDNDEDAEEESDDFDMFEQDVSPEEPKPQPNQQTNKQSVPKSTQSPYHESDTADSTQIIQNLANVNERNVLHTTALPAGSVSNKPNHQSSNGAATWTVAWNIHVYLSAILFTVLAVYSIFKMIFYDKLTHLFNQSYFICIHLILIIICLARIFFLCYDAYNIHSSFPTFISELLLNLPATFLTVAFATLILFLLVRSLNHKNNRYSALMRPLTVVVGSSVHVGLCITLHYVETNSNQNQMYAHAKYNGLRGNIHHSPPRVLSLICQIIYIFVCLSLGIFYLYVYRVLKRVLHNKSQNYIHGYQNLSYAIHITIATALLFVLLALLQVYGAISIPTTRPLISSSTEIDWLQCGYQFSLRLIEIAIITLLSWVTGLKTGASKVLQREKGKEVALATFCSNFHFLAFNCPQAWKHTMCPALLYSLARPVPVKNISKPIILPSAMLTPICTPIRCVRESRYMTTILH